MQQSTKVRELDNPRRYALNSKLQLYVESALRNAITVHFDFAGPKAKKRKGTKKSRETLEEIVNKVEQMQGTPEFFCHNILS